MKAWKDYTDSGKNTIFKLDEFISNPAPVTVSLQDVMKKVGKLLSSVMNLKVSAWPSPQDIKMVYGVGMLNRKWADNEQKSNIAVMIEFQCFEDDPTNLRLSIRTGGNVMVAYTLYQIVMFFFSV